MLEVRSLSFLLKSLSQNPGCCPSNKSLVFLGIENKKKMKNSISRGGKKNNKTFLTVPTFSSDLSYFILRDCQNTSERWGWGLIFATLLSTANGVFWFYVFCIIIVSIFPTSLFKLITLCFWLSPSSTHSSKWILYFHKQENQIN